MNAQLSADATLPCRYNRFRCRSRFLPAPIPASRRREAIQRRASASKWAEVGMRNNSSFMETSVVGLTLLLLVACSDASTSPAPARQLGGSPNGNVVGSFGVPVGMLENTISSGDIAVHYCDYAATTSPGPLTFKGQDCSTTANNLTIPLLSYTPGNPIADWTAPFAGSSWVGPTGDDAPSNEYRARVGSYEYVTSFNVPP